MNKNYPFKKIRKTLSKLRIPNKIILLIIGFLSTLWFIIRVIPKPSRAGYPCMQIAAPWMSGFVVYILSLGGITLLFKKSVTWLKNAKYWVGAIALVLSFVLMIVFNINNVNNNYVKAADFTRGELPEGAHNPMGVGKGVFPGRVVWEWNPEATNEDCENTISDAYFMEDNNNQDTINTMADNAIKKLAGKNTVNDAWDAIFKSFNSEKTGTASGYTNGQTIFIKVNNGQAGWAIDWSDMSLTGQRSAMTGVRNCAMTNTSPAPVVAFVRQLVDSCNIPQENIYVGEPMTHVYKNMYDAINTRYPNVVILDKEDRTSFGRTTSSGWTDDVIFYSDKGNDMPDAISDNLMQEMYDADYLINMSALKAHARGGVTLTAKNHFGSHGDHPGYGYGSFHLHAGLISTVDNDILNKGVRGNYGMYRVLTDLMGHEKIGLNTVLFVVDGLWSGIEATDMPVKWRMVPFNNDFPSSLFISQDAVALESVCIDFLRAEADSNEYFNDRPFFPAVDDHLHQAADSANWPDGFKYDPENDGTPIPSLGVHEHWNNPKSMIYTGNIEQGKGIELIVPENINYAPGVAKKINTKYYINKSEELVIVKNINEIFFDQNGDELTITYSSDNSDLSLSQKGDSIIVSTDTDMSETVKITLTANDGTNTVNYDVLVEVNTSSTYYSEYVIEAPIIDGSDADDCWDEVSWKNIDQVWLPYNATVAADDFTGKFKVVWTDDSLYILANITDDVIDINNPDPLVSYWEYDCLEIFIDPDNSGGDHTNNFNAFAYHLSAELNAIDISSDGSCVNLKDYINMAFTDNENNTYTWEIAMAVFDDSFNPGATNTPVMLENNMTIGFSVAYCDDDDVNTVGRDNFFGSTYVTAENENRHWQNADDFGDLILVGGPDDNHAPEIISSIDNIEINVLNENIIVVADLNTIFSDIDEDELTFSANSENSDLKVYVNNAELSVKLTDPINNAEIITVTVSDGKLTNETTFEVTYNDNSTSVNELMLSDNVAIYPNPANEFINIELNNDYSGIVHVAVYDNSGRMVITKSFNKSYFDFNQIINISSLQKAIYFIEINAGNMNKTKLLFIN